MDTSLVDLVLSANTERKGITAALLILETRGPRSPRCQLGYIGADGPRAGVVVHIVDVATRHSPGVDDNAGRWQGGAGDHCAPRCH